MNLERKNRVFEILVFRLIDWYSNNSSRTSLESFTKLKLQKLLFLVSAVNATIDHRGLLRVFDNFYAMPYGPVESDIYNTMIRDGFDHISFLNDYIEIKGQLNTNGFDCEKALIEKAILSLQDINPQLIHYTAAQLVEITHKWTSWKYAFEIANLLGKGSAKMDIDSICNDYKIYE